MASAFPINHFANLSPILELRSCEGKTQCPGGLASFQHADYVSGCQWQSF